MVYKCIIVGCHNTSRQQKLHALPSEPRFSEWIRIIKREDIPVSKRRLYHICDRHFSAKHKFATVRNRTNLRYDAYPDTDLFMDLLPTVVNKYKIPIQTKKQYKHTGKNEEKVTAEPVSEDMEDDNTILIDEVPEEQLQEDEPENDENQVCVQYVIDECEENEVSAKEPHCIICKKLLCDKDYYDIQSTTLAKLQLSLADFINLEVFDLKDESIKFLDNYSCHTCYDMFLKLEECLIQIKHIKGAIVQTYLETTGTGTQAIKDSSNYKEKTEKIVTFATSNPISKELLVTENAEVVLRKEDIAVQDSVYPQVEKQTENIQKFIDTNEVLQMTESRFCCEVCGRLFLRKHSFKMHLGMHFRTNLIDCKKCDRKFTHMKFLERHSVTHSDFKSFKCDLCDKAYYYQYSLQKHKEQIHKQCRRFNCMQCEKKFFFGHHLARHEKTHGAIKLHKCRICEARFLERYNMTAHMRMHDGKLVRSSRKKK